MKNLIIALSLLSAFGCGRAIEGSAAVEESSIVYVPAGSITVSSEVAPSSSVEVGQKPSLSRDGFTLGLIGELINSVGGQRDSIIKLMDLPDDTITMGQDNQLKYWKWVVKANNKIVSNVQVESRKEDKEVYNVTVSLYAFNLKCSQIMEYLAEAEPEFYWRKYDGDSATEYRVVTKRPDGTVVMLAAFTQSAFVEEKKTLDGQGSLVRSYSLGRDFNWKEGSVRKIWVGERTIIPQDTDWPMSSKSWTRISK